MPLFVFLPSTALAEEQITVDDTTYTYYVGDHDDVHINGISTNAASVTVPEKIGGRYVEGVYAVDAKEGGSTSTISPNVTNLDVSACSSLKFLECTNNNLTSLNVSGLANLISIYCDNNMLSSLKLSGLRSLTDLICSNNNLSSLDLSALTEL